MKRILIIGGGISGLSTLHFLKLKYADRPDITIELLEKKSDFGGTIRSQQRLGCIIESGPNGFLEQPDGAISLVRELGLEHETIKADPHSQKRYISFRNRLHEVPRDLKSFLSFKPLSPRDKFRLLKEPFVRSGHHPQESVYDFGKRRLGENFARILLDPMVAGIYAGKAQDVNLQCAFPKIYQLEKEYGSLVKGMLRKPRNKSAGKNSPAGPFSKGLISFPQGMSKLIDTLVLNYKENIRSGIAINAIKKTGEHYLAMSQEENFSADEIFMAVPAYSAAKICRELFPGLSENLARIYYAPVVVIGLIYYQKMMKAFPQGFGYLNPSSENRKVLGVLFNNNIFPQHVSKNLFVFRVMLGGAEHPELIQKPDQELSAIAVSELEAHFPDLPDPMEQVFIRWQQAIPQYNTEFSILKEKIESELTKIKGFYITGNYLAGISVNDCVRQARLLVQKSSL